jgi:GTPase
MDRRNFLSAALFGTVGACVVLRGTVEAGNAFGSEVVGFSGPLDPPNLGIGRRKRLADLERAVERFNRRIEKATAGEVIQFPIKGVNKVVRDSE